MIEPNIEIRYILKFYHKKGKDAIRYKHGSNVVPVRIAQNWFKGFQSGKTINFYLYCQQLMRLKQEVEKKHPELTNRNGVVFTMITPDYTHL
ncbi:hypothetical protein EVAR_8000_1 [Eumeta japonica]|uniref:Mos1 transposase HTH domain-containing protein n=1 Tax=Eumeta variegata TaxID=151549 RepID=A0A4C1TI49_EUMVA|nr:hypothetical protein EVAR_8000_1 [Eumeta japonica]